MRRGKHGFDFAASARLAMDVVPNRVRDFAIFRRDVNRGEGLEPESLKIANSN
jgi:hypothetical protein